MNKKLEEKIDESEKENHISLNEIKRLETTNTHLLEDLTSSL